jgi:hypothetical protein
MYIHAFLIIFTNLWVDLREQPEISNHESGLQHNCLLFIKKSFSLINRMPEIIDINKHLSYGKRQKDKKKKRKAKQNGKKGVVNSSVFSFLDRSLISVGVFNYYLPLLCA